MKRVHIFRRGILAWALMATMWGLVSCDNGLIFEGEGDCGVYYRIRFKYDYNIKFADAFANEVNSIALYVFDENDVLVKEIATTDKTALSSGTFEIPLELQPGEYTLLAWGGLMNEESFDLLAETQVGVTRREEMQVKMLRHHDEKGRAGMNKPKTIVQLETVISHKHACPRDRKKNTSRTSIPRPCYTQKEF